MNHNLYLYMDISILLIVNNYINKHMNYFRKANYTPMRVN